MTIIEALQSEDGKWLRLNNHKNEDFERVLWYENDKFIVIEYGSPSKIIIKTNNEEQAVSELLKG